ncbi:uncharacterized protein METZ01_LOCUS284515, partial [marine metagenome]
MVKAKTGFVREGTKARKKTRQGNG